MKKILFGCSMLLALTLLSGGFTSAGAQEVKEVRKTKKGWSKKAKGAAIGTGAGAVTGAVVSKNDSKGAVIGGVVGGTAGYLYGRHKDKKNPNRKTVYKYKRKAD